MDSSEQIRFGILGCSNVAKQKTIPAIIKSKNSKLERIGSRSTEKQKEFSKTFGCEKYGNYQDIIDDENVDAVYISLPIALQMEWVLKAAENGKHVLCEKSVAITYESAKNMVNAAKKNGVRMLEAFMFRFHPQHQKFLELVGEGVAGEPSFFEAKYGSVLTSDRAGFRFNRNLGGGALNDYGCYTVCASRMMFGNDVEGVMSNLTLDENNKIDTKGTFYLIYSNSKIAFGTFSFNNFYQSTYSVWGTKSIIGLDRAFSIPANTKSIIRVKSKEGSREIEIPWVDQIQLMIDEFSRVLLKKKENSFDYENDIIFQAKIMEAIRKSALEDRFVKIDEI